MPEPTPTPRPSRFLGGGGATPTRTPQPIELSDLERLFREGRISESEFRRRLEQDYHYRPADIDLIIQSTLATPTRTPTPTATPRPNQGASLSNLVVRVLAGHLTRDEAIGELVAQGKSQAVAESEFDKSYNVPSRGERMEAETLRAQGTPTGTMPTPAVSIPTATATPTATPTAGRAGAESTSYDPTNPTSPFFDPSLGASRGITAPSLGGGAGLLPGSQTGTTTASKPRTYSASVERWRPLVEQYFPAELVDKALYVINYESGGNPLASGDGGMSIGLFQIQSDERFAGRPTKEQLADPEFNIKDAAQALGAASGKWADWGEGTSYEGKPFGALGNHPYDSITASKGGAVPPPPRDAIDMWIDANAKGWQKGQISKVGDDHWMEVTGPKGERSFVKLNPTFYPDGRFFEWVPSAAESQRRPTLPIGGATDKTRQFYDFLGGQKAPRDESGAIDRAAAIKEFGYLPDTSGRAGQIPPLGSSESYVPSSMAGGGSISGQAVTREGLPLIQGLPTTAADLMRRPESRGLGGLPEQLGLAGVKSSGDKLLDTLAAKRIYELAGGLIAKGVPNKQAYLQAGTMLQEEQGIELDPLKPAGITFKERPASVEGYPASISTSGKVGTPGTDPAAIQRYIDFLMQGGVEKDPFADLEFPEFKHGGGIKLNEPAFIIGASGKKYGLFNEAGYKEKLKIEPTKEPITSGIRVRAPKSVPRYQTGTQDEITPTPPTDQLTLYPPRYSYWGQPLSKPPGVDWTEQELTDYPFTSPKQSPFYGLADMPPASLPGNPLSAVSGVVREQRDRDNMAYRYSLAGLQQPRDIYLPEGKMPWDYSLPPGQRFAPRAFSTTELTSIDDRLEETGGVGSEIPYVTKLNALALTIPGGRTAGGNITNVVRSGNWTEVAKRLNIPLAYVLMAVGPSLTKPALLGGILAEPKPAPLPPSPPDEDMAA